MGMRPAPGDGRTVGTPWNTTVYQFARVGGEMVRSRANWRTGNLWDGAYRLSLSDVLHRETKWYRSNQRVLSPDRIASGDYWSTQLDGRD